MTTRRRDQALRDYLYWFDETSECLVEATNTLGWQNPGEMEFNEALAKVFHELAERHGIRLS
jgi:hypothetical protein